MEAQLIKIYEKNNSQALIDQVVQVLNKNGVIIYPTDTMYALGCSIQSAQAIVSPNTTTTYTLTGTDANGCVASATRYFEFVDIKIPNVFTPNGDGDNDGWTPTNTMNYPDLIFYVFDRYGRKVGTYREGQFWDGKYNGSDQPFGVYVYELEAVTEAGKIVTKRGNITLIR